MTSPTQPTADAKVELVARLSDLERAVRALDWKVAVPDDLQSEVRMLFNEALAGGPNMNGDGGPTLTPNHALDCVWAAQRIAALEASHSLTEATLREALERVQDEANTVCGDWRETASMIDSICIAALAMQDARPIAPEMIPTILDYIEAPCAEPPLGPSPGYREVTIDRNSTPIAPVQDDDAELNEILREAESFVVILRDDADFVRRNPTAIAPYAADRIEKAANRLEAVANRLGKLSLGDER